MLYEVITQLKHTQGKHAQANPPTPGQIERAQRQTMQAGIVVNGLRGPDLAECGHPIGILDPHSDSPATELSPTQAETGLLHQMRQGSANHIFLIAVWCQEMVPGVLLPALCCRQYRRGIDAADGLVKSMGPLVAEQAQLLHRENRGLIDPIDVDLIQTS